MGFLQELGNFLTTPAMTRMPAALAARKNPRATAILNELWNQQDARQAELDQKQAEADKLNNQSKLAWQAMQEYNAAVEGVTDLKQRAAKFVEITGKYNLPPELAGKAWSAYNDILKGVKKRTEVRPLQGKNGPYLGNIDLDTNTVTPIEGAIPYNEDKITSPFQLWKKDNPLGTAQDYASFELKNRPPDKPNEPKYVVKPKKMQDGTVHYISADPITGKEYADLGEVPPNSLNPLAQILGPLLGGTNVDLGNGPASGGGVTSPPPLPATKPTSQVAPKSSSTPSGKTTGHPLAGKIAGKYMVNGKVVKWDGSKEIK